MDNGREHGKRKPLREGIEQSGSDNGHWDAVGSLKRNAKRPVDEVTPLLSNSSGPPDEHGNGLTVSEWEGNADFVGLTWWRTPSVSLAHLADRLKVLVLELMPRSCTGYYRPSSFSLLRLEASSSRN